MDPQQWQQQQWEAQGQQAAQWNPAAVGYDPSWQNQQWNPQQMWLPPQQQMWNQQQMWLPPQAAGMPGQQQMWMNPGQQQQSWDPNAQWNQQQQWNLLQQHQMVGQQYGVGVGVPQQDARGSWGSAGSNGEVQPVQNRSSSTYQGSGLPGGNILGGQGVGVYPQGWTQEQQWAQQAEHERQWASSMAERPPNAWNEQWGQNGWDQNGQMQGGVKPVTKKVESKPKKEKEMTLEEFKAEKARKAAEAAKKREAEAFARGEVIKPKVQDNNEMGDFPGAHVQLNKDGKRIMVMSKEELDRTFNAAAALEPVSPTSYLTTKPTPGTKAPGSSDVTPKKNMGMSPKSLNSRSPKSLPEEEYIEENFKPRDDLPEPDSRPHANIVFIGHVDAGKSTTCGNILFLSGHVDEQKIEKYKREAKEKNRDSWFLAYIMDTSEEEKAKGKTVEVGRALFATENKRFTILDAPGHKAYVPNMISGASQADIGVLIISARKGEFETGFEKGGQTSEHALLAMTLGVSKLILAVNKMDDANWAEERYNEIVEKITPFLKNMCGFKDDQLIWLPIAGLTGDNIKEKKGTGDWYKGPTLFDILDAVEVTSTAKKEGPLRMPMLDGYRDMGALMGIGKVEQGTIRPGNKCMIQPIGKTVQCQAIFIGEEEVSHATVGESVTVKLSNNISEEDLRKGFVLCPFNGPVRPVIKFKAQFKILELVEGRPVLTAGYRCVVHFHTAIEDCEITKLLEVVENKTKKKTVNPKFAKIDQVLTCVVTLDRKAALDSFSNCEKLGRFTMRDEGITVGIGKIMELPKEKN